MKARTLSPTALLSIVLALGSAALLSQKASAACYDQNKQPVPCPQQPNEKNKKPTPTDQPTKVPTPTVTATKEASAPVTVLVTPDASQLALFCASFPAAANTNPSPGSSAGAGSAPPALPSSDLGIGPFEFAGGGLLGGVLISLLVPAVLRRTGLRQLLGVKPSDTQDKSDSDDQIKRVSAELYNEEIDLKFGKDDFVS